jgi:hypothetical protein
VIKLPYLDPEKKKEWRRQYKLRYPQKHQAWKDAECQRRKEKAKALKKPVEAWSEQDTAKAIREVAGAIAEARKRIMARDRMRVCSRCKKTKALDDFRLHQGRTDRWQSWCKACEIKYVGRWQRRNPDKLKQYSATTYARIKNDPAKKIRKSIRNRISKAIKLHGRGVHVQGGKLRYMGCTAAQAVAHIERQMNGRMTWENYGSYWHIDHIQPCAAYDLGKEEDRRKAFHYTNLQPLCAKANARKGAKITKQIHQPELILA